MRPAVRNVAFNLGGQILPMLVALVAMPALVQHAGTSRLGFLGVAWALIGYFSLLDLGLSRIVTRRIALASTRAALTNEITVLKRLCNGLFLVVMILSALLALVVPAHALVGSGTSPEIVDEARPTLYVLWATLPVTVVTGLLRGALEGVQAFGRANVLRAVFGAWSFAAPLAVLPWSHELLPLVAAMSVGRVVSLIAHALVARQALASHLAHLDRGEPVQDRPTMPPLLEFVREGGWLTVSNVVGPMLVTFDRFLIAPLVSLAAASYYFVPQEVSLRMLVVPAAVSTAVFPLLARSTRADAGVDRMRITATALRAIIVTCLPPCALLCVAAQPLLSLWMGPTFAEQSAPVASSLAVGLFANCCAQVPFASIQAAARADVTGRLHLLQLPIYAVLLYVLTSRFGIIGAAIAWSLRAVMDAAMLHAAAARLFHRDARLDGTISAIGGLAALTAIAVVQRHPGAGSEITSVVTVACCLTITGIVLRESWKGIRR